MKVWAYVIENQLRCALLHEAIPEGIQTQEFEVATTDDLYLENGVIKQKDLSMKLSEHKDRVKNDAMALFATQIGKTDYIMLKALEKNTTPADMNESVWQRRLALREVWEDFETKLSNATTINEVNIYYQEFIGIANEPS